MSNHDSDFAALRAREFGGARGRVYLNAASYGPLPQRSRQAMASFHERRWQATLVDDDLVAPLVAARTAVARLIGCAASEVALTPNTSIGINIGATAAMGGTGRGRVILVHDREFPANVYPWLALEQHGLKVEFVPTDANGLPREDAFVTRIERGDVAAASVSFVQFATGYRADLARLGAVCRRYGTLFVVDAIQGLGAIPLSVRDCDVDILACGGQKWLCAPWGSGFAYVRRELLEAIDPLLPGWLSFEATQDFTRLVQYRYELLRDARRFETGTLAYQDYLGLQHSLEILLELGVPAIWQHVRALQQPIIDWATARAVEVVSDLAEDRRSGVLCLRPPAADSLFASLERNGVRCALREGLIRLSPHWYNNSDDIARVVAILDRCLAA